MRVCVVSVVLYLGWRPRSLDKKVMEEEPLDEDIVWGQGEDVEWSDRVREKYKYVMNTHSAVKLDHYKDPILPVFDYQIMSQRYVTRDLA